ncbi:MAG: SCO family protein [Alphaproteobacteria bacterium]|nr:SCO family protein [Alphaproteobacteria bacterium]
MVWMLAACSLQGPPPDAHGTVLHAGPHTLLVQHDDLRNRVVPGVERYEASGLGVAPGDGIDLFLDDGRVRSVAVTGPEELPAGFVAGGVPLVGTVVNVDGVRVTIDHEAVPDVMPAMVMGFGLAPWEASGLTVGDRVEARLLRSGYGWQLVDPVVTGHVEGGLRKDVKPLAPGEVLPRTELVAEDGRPIVVGAGQGVPTLLTYIYTRCPDPDFCPAIGQRLAALQGSMRGGRIVTVSIDPDHDTPEVLAAWGRAMGADTAVWRLARAEPLALQDLALYGGQHVTIDGGRISHLHRVLILDADGRLVERYDTNAWPMDRVVGQLAP